MEVDKMCAIVASQYLLDVTTMSRSAIELILAYLTQLNENIYFGKDLPNMPDDNVTYTIALNMDVRIYYASGEKSFSYEGEVDMISVDGKFKFEFTESGILYKFINGGLHNLPDTIPLLMFRRNMVTLPPVSIYLKEHYLERVRLV